MPEACRAIVETASGMEDEITRVADLQAITTDKEWREHRQATITALVDLLVDKEVAHDCFPREMSAETRRKQLREFQTKS